MAAETWSLIHAERRSLVDDLEALTEAQWVTQSLCAEWTVRDVLAHMTSTAKMSPGKFFGRFIGSGFKFNDFTKKGVDAELGTTPTDTLSRFKNELNATSHPPGPLDAMVVEAVLHTEDIRRPLGITHTFPAETLVRAGNSITASNLLIGGKGRSAGITLRPTDVEWTKGTGPEVTGPMIALLLVITGRKAGLSDLSGEGLATLTQRV